MPAGQVKYTVYATVINSDVLKEYVDWLESGHAQALVDAGALSYEIKVLDVAEGESPKVEAAYIFPSKEVLDAYFEGPALLLREDGKTRWIDTEKVSFSRNIENI